MQCEGLTSMSPFQLQEMVKALWSIFISRCVDANDIGGAHTFSVNCEEDSAGLWCVWDRLLGDEVADVVSVDGCYPVGYGHP